MMMGSPKRYSLEVIMIMSISLLASWSCMRDGNEVMGADQARGVMKHKRLALVQRKAGARVAFSACLASKSQAERQSALQEVAKAESGRIQFIKAKLGLPDAAEGTSGTSQLSSLRTPLYSGQIVNGGNYLMTVGLGTPASELLWEIDTGSDLAWTQCMPCISCYKQRDAIFDPTASTSYKQVPCSSQQCAQLGILTTGTCNSSSTTAACDYRIDYLDESFTAGDFAMDVLSVSGEAVATAFPFGCGHDNQGLFQGLDGLLGLSRSALALPAQTEAAFGGVFAYCMPPIDSTAPGYIEFGKEAAAEAEELAEGKAKAAAKFGIATIPLVGLSASSLYLVTVESIQIQGTSSTANSFNIVVDSGTIITRLDKPVYTAVTTAYTKAASATPGVEQAPSSAGMGILDTCFTTAANPADVFPALSFSFMDGSTFTLPVENLFAATGENDTYCLVLLPLDLNGISILGNYQQQSRLLTFDIASSTLSISSSACL